MDTKLLVPKSDFYLEKDGDNTYLLLEDDKIDVTGNMELVNRLFNTWELSKPVPRAKLRKQLNDRFDLGNIFRVIEASSLLKKVDNDVVFYNRCRKEFSAGTSVKTVINQVAKLKSLGVKRLFSDEITSDIDSITLDLSRRMIQNMSNQFSREDFAYILGRLTVNTDFSDAIDFYENEAEKYTVRDNCYVTMTLGFDDPNVFFKIKLLGFTPTESTVNYRIYKSNPVSTSMVNSVLNHN